MNMSWCRGVQGGLLCWLALAACLQARPVRAQTTETGALRGVVAASTGDPLAQAVILLAEAASGRRYELTTDHEGRFRSDHLPPGLYDVLVERIGFRPTALRRIPVRPGRTTVADLQLEATAVASPDPVERTFDAGVSTTARAGSGEWLAAPAALPSDRREFRDLLLLSSRLDAVSGVEGLPAAGTLLLGGTLFRPARLPHDGWAAPVTGFALHGFGAAMAATVPLSVRLPFGASGMLVGFPARGEEARSGAHARWSGQVLPGSEVAGGDVPDYTEVLGGLELAGASAAGTAHYALGVHGSAIERPFSAAWPLTDAASALLGETTEQGAEPAAYARPMALQDRSYGGFAAGEAQLAAGHALRGSLHFTTLAGIDRVDAATGLLSRVEGTDVAGGLALVSTFGRNANELRVTFTRSEREADAADSLPSTFFAAEALALGSAAPTGRAAENTIRLADAFSLRTGSLDFTIGADVLLGSYELNQPGREAFFFGGLPQLQAGNALHLRLDPGPVLVEWSAPAYGIFTEVAAEPSAGLSLRLGARVERETLPTDEVRADSRWQQLTGVPNNAAEGPGWLFSPRLAMSWQLDEAQRWVLDLDAGIYTERYDPLLLGAWQQLAGTGAMHRTLGAVDWPRRPAASGSSGAALLLLAPDFEPVRSSRVSGGVTHQLAPGTTLQLSAAVRRTRNLPQREDLNLRQPQGNDQHGRDIYGTLLQQGALLAAVPGTGRVLPVYDEVAGIASSAGSDYMGVTLAAERQLAPTLTFQLRYTFSRTTDDWFGGRTGGWRSTVPADLAEQGWADGTSDFDVPHRLVAAGLYRAPFGLELAAALRIQSGIPFTPGFRFGVDPNADGDIGNDPAFVDPDLDGMAALIGEWDCLAERSGQFAERNGCRGESLQALDLSARVPLLTLRGARAALLVDALDVLGAGPVAPDPALLLINPDAGMTLDGTTVTVPYVVNPGFGQELVRRQTGRRIRLGASLTW